jgi:hypothetical protein
VNSEAYQEISDGTPLDLFSGWAEITAMNGEDLPLTGSSYTLGSERQLWISDAGFLNIDEAPTSTVFISALFTDFGGLVPIDASSSLTAAVHGPAGDRHLIIQWKNYRRSDGVSGDFVNFQIQVHQATGTIEMRYGPHEDGNATYSGAAAPNAGYYFANYDASTIYDRIWLLGNSASPTLSTTPVPQFNGVSTIPANGTVYRFTPTWSVGMQEAGDAQFFSVRIDPASDRAFLYFVDAGGHGSITLRDMLGRTVMTRPRTNDVVELPMTGLPGRALIIDYVAADGRRQALRCVRP